jgi:CheY-like chemotaxis protein
VAGPAEPLTAVAATATTPGGTETILVVEDDPAVRGILSAMLRQRGYRVLEASDGRAAVDLAAGPEELDLLITDLVMPDMSGRELADRLAAQRPGLRTLFVSGYGHSALVHRGALGPGMAYLAKPFSTEELARKVRQLLDARGQGG